MIRIAGSIEREKRGVDRFILMDQLGSPNKIRFKATVRAVADRVEPLYFCPTFNLGSACRPKGKNSLYFAKARNPYSARWERRSAME